MLQGREGIKKYQEGNCVWEDGRFYSRNTIVNFIRRKKGSSERDSYNLKQK